MAKKRRSKYRGIAQPVYAREPLLIRLCASLVDNLTLILRTAFVIGSIFLVQELQLIFENGSQSTTESTPSQIVSADVNVIDEGKVPKTALSDGVKSALNCTYENYRKTHYDECVKEPSQIYQRPQADPDDMGLVSYDTPTLYARLDNTTNSNRRPNTAL